MQLKGQHSIIRGVTAVLSLRWMVDDFPLTGLIEVSLESGDVQTRVSQGQVDFLRSMSPWAKPHVTHLMVKGKGSDVDGARTVENLVRDPGDVAIEVY